MAHGLIHGASPRTNRQTHLVKPRRRNPVRGEVDSAGRFVGPRAIDRGFRFFYQSRGGAVPHIASR